MNIREGVKRAYVASCALVCVAIVGLGVASLPSEENALYGASGRVLDAAKSSGLAHGDGNRYGAYSKWSSREIYANFCEGQIVYSGLRDVCNENKVTTASVWRAKGIALLELAGYLAMFILAAWVVLLTSSWIGNGFTGKKPTI